MQSDKKRVKVTMLDINDNESKEIVEINGRQPDAWRFDYPYDSIRGNAKTHYCSNDKLESHYSDAMKAQGWTATPVWYIELGRLEQLTRLEEWAHSTKHVLKFAILGCRPLDDQMIAINKISLEMIVGEFEILAAYQEKKECE